MGTLDTYTKNKPTLGSYGGGGCVVWQGLLAHSQKYYNNNMEHQK